MNLKLLVLFSSVSFVIAFSVDANSSKDLSFNGRGIGKNINLIMDLFKLTLKKEATTEKPKPAVSHLQLVPHDGLGYKYRLRHHYVEEPTKPTPPEKPEPQFWFFDKFSNNMDYALMTKILLKIIVFKKIIKFIALICLLFLIPALNSKDEETDDDKMARNLDPYAQIDYRTKEVYSFAINAIEGFSSDKVVWCVAEHDIYCRFQTMFDNIDQSYTVDQIIKYWRPDSALKKKSISTKVYPEHSDSETESIEDESLQLTTPYTYDMENEIETQEPEQSQQDD